MRLIHVFIPEERQDAVLGVLNDRDVDYVITAASGVADGGLLVEFPLPTDAVNDVLDGLHEAGLDEESYIVVGAAETAETGTMELLENRYASDFSPLAAPELRSKARDLSHDLYSYVALVILSAVIAAGGLLVDSPAVVVGSMVIAPLVGPVLTTGVGAVIGDKRMLTDSVRFQVIGLVAAVGTATLFSFVLRFTGFVPTGLALSSIELVSVRLAPTLVTVVVGLAAGSAATFALTTKGPTALVGVMIAAALLPAAAVVGIALVWGSPVVAFGAAVLLLVVGGVLFGTGVQLSFERGAAGAVDDVLQRPSYDALSLLKSSSLETIHVNLLYTTRAYRSLRILPVLIVVQVVVQAQSAHSAANRLQDQVTRHDRHRSVQETDVPRRISSLAVPCLRTCRTRRTPHPIILEVGRDGVRNKS